jgi:DNA-binding FadR family transcriptional regulator
MLDEHQLRPAIARAIRSGDPEAVREARRDHAAALLAKRIKSVVDTAPEFTPEQLAELRGLLGGAA